MHNINIERFRRSVKEKPIEWKIIIIVLSWLFLVMFTILDKILQATIVSLLVIPMLILVWKLLGRIL